MEKEQQKKIVAIREGLIEGHRKYLDGQGNPDVAMCRQKDVAFILERAIKIFTITIKIFDCTINYRHHTIF